MEKEANGFSIHQAFACMIKEMKENDDLQGIKTPTKFINIDELNLDGELYDDLINLMKETGTVVGYCIKQPTDNPNQIQTQVKDTIVKGDKKWATMYLAVYDTPWGNEVVPNSKAKTKKECVDIARAASSEENRDTFVLIGKSTDGFPRCMAQCLYKPSPKQQPGLYYFAW